LGGFELLGPTGPIAVPPAAQKLLAFLAVHSRALHRSYVAGTLWSDCSEERSHANLRSAIWRLHRPGHELVQSIGSNVRLSPEITVDLHEAAAAAGRVSAGQDADTVAEVGLETDLLPDWDEVWILAERERLRQLRLHALETVCRRLTAAGRYGEAVQAGLAAVRGEPLRESAQRALIAVHLAEGNDCEALRQYRSFDRLISTELGLEPSPRMVEMVQHLVR
jgi:DNA-binding SARP family transcriptional activator